MRPPERPWPSLELTSTGVLAPQVTELPVPPLESDAGGIGHGSSVLVHSIRHQIYWSRPYGRQPVPWSRYDLPSGDLRTVTGRNGLHGDLRDWVIDPDGRHAWSLLTHGLARLDLEEMREVAILRTRFPKFLVSLMDLGNGLLAAAHWTGETITLVDREQLRIVKTLRMPSPEAAVLGDDLTIDFVSFNGGVARRLDLATLTLGPRRVIPRGQRPAVRGSVAWIVQGTPSIDPRAPTLRRLSGTHISEVDLATGTIIRRSPPLEKPIQVFGLDQAGRPFVALEHGLVLLDAATLAPLFELKVGSGPVAMLPDGRSAVTIPTWFRHDRIVFINW